PPTSAPAPAPTGSRPSSLSAPEAAPAPPVRGRRAGRTRPATAAAGPAAPAAHPSAAAATGRTAGPRPYRAAGARTPPPAARPPRESAPAMRRASRSWESKEIVLFLFPPSERVKRGIRPRLWKTGSALGARSQFVANFSQQRLGRGRRGGRRFRLGRLLPAQLVDALDQQEDGDRHDQELDQGVEEGAVLDGHLLDRLGGRILGLQHPFQPREIDTAGDQADRRHDHLVDQALDD